MAVFLLLNLVLISKRGAVGQEQRLSLKQIPHKLANLVAIPVGIVG